MAKYFVEIDGKTETFEGSNAFFNSIRTSNLAERSADGVSKHTVTWANEQGILTHTNKGDRVGVPK